jgi:hypothetical protein
MLHASLSSAKRTYRTPTQSHGKHVRREGRVRVRRVGGRRASEVLSRVGVGREKSRAHAHVRFACAHPAPERERGRARASDRHACAALVFTLACAQVSWPSLTLTTHQPRHSQPQSSEVLAEAAADTSAAVDTSSMPRGWCSCRRWESGRGEGLRATGFWATRRTVWHVVGAGAARRRAARARRAWPSSRARVRRSSASTANESSAMTARRRRSCFRKLARKPRYVTTAISRSATTLNLQATDNAKAPRRSSLGRQRDLSK